MKREYTPFRNLNEEMTRKKICMEDLSKTLALPTWQVQEKLAGEQTLFLDEAVRIRNTYFPMMDVKYLFASGRKENRCGWNVIVSRR